MVAKNRAKVAKNAYIYPNKLISFTRRRNWTIVHKKLSFILEL